MGIQETSEPKLIQALISESAIEGLDKGILDWLAGIDEVQIDMVVAGPDNHRFACKLWTVIYHDLFGQPSAPAQPLQNFNYPRAWNITRDLYFKAFSRAIVDDVERPKLTSV